MTQIKEYQSNRNRYTKQSWPAVGKGRTECPSGHWWDVRGKCVMCGVDKEAEEAATEMVSEGGPAPLPNRTQQEAYDEDERYSGPSQSWHGGDDA